MGNIWQSVVAKYSKQIMVPGAGQWHSWKQNQKNPLCFTWATSISSDKLIFDICSSWLNSIPCWLVVWLPFLFSHILGCCLLIIPIDFHIVQRGGPTTNQLGVCVFVVAVSTCGVLANFRGQVPSALWRTWFRPRPWSHLWTCWDVKKLTAMNK